MSELFNFILDALSFMGTLVYFRSQIVFKHPLWYLPNLPITYFILKHASVCLLQLNHLIPQSVVILVFAS